MLVVVVVVVVVVVLVVVLVVVAVVVVVVIDAQGSSRVVIAQAGLSSPWQCQAMLQATTGIESSLSQKQKRRPRWRLGILERAIGKKRTRLR